MGLSCTHSSPSSKLIFELLQSSVKVVNAAFKDNNIAAGPHTKKNPQKSKSQNKADSK